jgi:prolyl-tRNA synthetase
MQDAYSFDIDQAGLDRAFEAHRQAYLRIFARCGLPALAVEAFSGMMGGRESTEFMVRTQAGEDTIAICPSCGYAANLEVATSRLAPIHDEPSAELERFATPGVVTIEALAAPPYAVAPTHQLKTLVYVSNVSEAVVAVVRGDDVLNEAKLQLATGGSDLRPASAEEIVEIMGAHAGSLGAVHLHRPGVRVLIDQSLAERTNVVTGANTDGVHVRGVDVARDILAFGAEPVDLRTVRAGEGCPCCEGGQLELDRSLEIGHIFKLGTRFSEPLGVSVLNADGRAVPIVMGSYGIGIGRILAAAVELFHDADGIIWPVPIAPFAATVLTLGHEPALGAAAEQVVAALQSAGLDVLYDDRPERAGVKFKDADLIGIPLRIAVGQSGLARGAVEWKLRRDRQLQLVPLEEVAARARAGLDVAL